MVRRAVRLGGASFENGPAVSLFPTSAVTFDVGPGPTFVLEEPNTSVPDRPLRIIENWFEELKAKAPPRR